MATLVSFHAHPDDESIATGGTLARAAAEGHRVVLVFATRGECGEVPEGFLADGEDLGERRAAETDASARVLGVHRVAFLGYRDSGMMGEPTNDDPACFWRADPAEAADRLAALLTEEGADVLTVYDDHGGYGHPDHIQVHRVGLRAAELAGVPVVAQSTFPREVLVARIMEMVPEGSEPPRIDTATFGKPAAEITHRVEAAAHAGAKRASMRAHRSQMGDAHFMLAMPDDVFAASMGTEHYLVRDLPDEVPELFTELFTPTR